MNQTRVKLNEEEIIIYVAYDSKDEDIKIGYGRCTENDMYKIVQNKYGEPIYTTNKGITTIPNGYTIYNVIPKRHIKLFNDFKSLYESLYSKFRSIEIDNEIRYLNGTKDKERRKELYLKYHKLAQDYCKKYRNSL